MIDILDYAELERDIRNRINKLRYTIKFLSYNSVSHHKRQALFSRTNKLLREIAKMRQFVTHESYATRHKYLDKKVTNIEKEIMMILLVQ